MQTFRTRQRQLIDLETWERRASFDFFKSVSEPYHGMCIRMDCSATFSYAKDHGFSVFLSLLHRSLVAAQQIENFRTRIVDGVVWRYEEIHAGSAVGRPNGTIGFGHYRYCEDLKQFITEASAEVDRVRRRIDLERYPEANLIRYSSLPWFDFTSISHARDFVREDSAPRITFGKISEGEGRRTLPVSIHVHHALADGSHVADFISRFQSSLDEPELDSDSVAWSSLHVHPSIALPRLFLLLRKGESPEGGT